MLPAKAARVLRRIAQKIESSKNPSRESVRKDLTHLRWAMAGNRSSYRYLVSRFMRRASDMDLLRQIDQTFNAGDVYSPVMKKSGDGYSGDIGDGIMLEVGISGDKFSYVKVNGLPVEDLKEAVETYKHLKSNPTVNQPEGGASSDGNPSTAKCDECGKDFDTEETYGVCPHCNAEHTQCPGCEGWYEMNKNVDDHCPLCGYSSWGSDEEQVRMDYYVPATPAAGMFDFRNVKTSQDEDAHQDATQEVVALFTDMSHGEFFAMSAPPSAQYARVVEFTCPEGQEKDLEEEVAELIANSSLGWLAGGDWKPA